MRITMRTLLIYTAVVGVAFGLARLPPFVGSACQIVEILILACFVPLRLQFWTTPGIIAGILLGLVVVTNYEHWTRADPTGLITLEDMRTYYADRTAQLGRLIAYGSQLGALMGGTVGLILGEVRFQSQQRTLATMTRS